jgi:hypothetical protein
MSKTVDWPYFSVISPKTAVSLKQPEWTKTFSASKEEPKYSNRKKRLAKAYSAGK